MISNIKCLKYLTYLFFLQNLFYSCTNNTSTEIPEKITRLIKINSWTAFGPFKFDTLSQKPQKTIFNDDLRSSGIKENEVKSENIDVLRRMFKETIIQEKDGDVDLFDYCEGNKKDKGNFYLFTTLNSNIEQDVVLTFDYASSIIIWLNNDRIFEGFQKRNVNKRLNRFVTVRLKKGNNNLLVKVNRYLNISGWKLIFYVTSSAYGKEIYRANYIEDFVSTPNFNDSLEVYLGPYSLQDVKHFDLTKISSQHKVNLALRTTTATYSTNTSTLSDGFYKCTMVLDKDTLRETIYKGDLFKLEAALINDERNYKIAPLIKKELDMNIAKFSRSLRNKQDSVSANVQRESNKIRVFYAFAAYNASLYLKTGNHTFKDMPGTSLKSYNSKLQNGDFGFLYHCNESLIANDKKIPLLLFIPYDLKDKEFLKSNYYDITSQIEADIALADKYGFAIAWPYLKGKNNYDTIIEDDLNSMLEALKMNYNIDTTKTFLLGDSEGATRALSIATNNPSKFKGLYLISPAGIKNWTINAGSSIKQLKGTSIQIARATFDKYPKELISYFIEKIRFYGINPSYVEYYGWHISHRKDHREIGFKFLQNIH